MKRYLWVRIGLAVVLSLSLGGLYNHTLACGCTGCVQVDEGYYGCWEGSGCASICSTDSNGWGCYEGGYAPEDGCVGPAM